MTGDWRERIAADPAVLSGKPTVRGTRLGVAFLLNRLAAGWTRDDLLENYPRLTAEDVEAVLRHAAEAVGEERVFPAVP